MIVAERNRLDTTSEAVRDGIQDDITWLEQELANIDNGLTCIIRKSSLWRGKDDLLLYLQGADSKRDVEGTQSYHTGREEDCAYDSYRDSGTPTHRTESYTHHHYPDDEPDGSVHVSHVAPHCNTSWLLSAVESRSLSVRLAISVLGVYILRSVKFVTHPQLIWRNAVHLKPKILEVFDDICDRLA